MYDRNITLELYPETKRIVDKIILDEDYEHTDTPCFNSDITMLEVLRIYFSFVVAKNYKKQKTLSQLQSMIDPQGIQEWLQWHKDTSADDKGELYFDKYKGKQPVPILKNISIYSYEAIVTSYRNTLYYNKFYNSFQNQSCKIDGEMLQKICEEIETSAASCNIPGLIVPSASKIAASYVDKARSNHNSDASIELDFKGTGGAMLLQYKPFSITGIPLSRIAKVHAEESERLKDLSIDIQKILESSKWPDISNCKLLFSIRGYLVDDEGAYGDSIRVTFTLRYTNLDNILNEEIVDVYLGRLTYKRSWDKDCIIEQYESMKTHGVSHLPGDLLENHIKKVSDRESQKLKRRIRKLEEIGKDRLKVDDVSQYLLEIILKHDPDKYEEIFQNKLTRVKLPIGKLKGFLNGRRSKKDSSLLNEYETITFKIEEGQLRSIFHINDDYYWDKNRLRVGDLPVSILKSLPGKQASNVVDHPIADLLGKVIRAYPYKNKYNWITFDSKNNSVDISDIHKR